MTRHPNRPTARRILRTTLTTALPALAAVVALTASGVLDALHAALLVVVVAAAVRLWRSLDDGDESPWPDPPVDRRDGARNDVSELGWATFTRDGSVGGRMLRRVRDLARARLAAHGVDLDAPGGHDAAVRLLGPDAVALLGARGSVDRLEVHRCLDALEHLDAPPLPRSPATPTSRRHDR